MARLLATLAGCVLLGIAALAVYVEREAPYSFASVSGRGAVRALVLYHPSRDAHFSDDISSAMADGLASAGLAVDRATLTRATPSPPEGYALLAIVSNTYFWSPDMPTLRYLRRTPLRGVPVIGVIGGAGATGRAERMLARALERSGATVLATRSLWLLRPNDEARMQEPNRRVALDQARQLGAAIGRRVLRERRYRATPASADTINNASCGPL